MPRRELVDARGRPLRAPSGPRLRQGGFLLNPYRFGGGGGGGGEATTILAKLTSWWELDESSGTRGDSHGSQDLSLFGTEAGVADGVRGGGDNAAVFSGSNNFFRTSEADLQIPASNGNWCMFGWFYLTSNSGSKGLMSKWDVVSVSTLERVLSVQSGVAYGQSSNGASYINASTAAPSVTTWHFYVVWKDSDHYVRLRIDDATTFASPGTASATPNSTQFSIGSFQGASSRMVGRAQRAGWIKGGVLTADEITYLYNSGNSKTYAEVVADA